MADPPSVGAKAEPVSPAIATAAAEPMRAVRTLQAWERADAAARCRLERTTLRAASCQMATEKLPAIQQGLSDEAAPSDRLAGGCGVGRHAVLPRAGVGPIAGLGPAPPLSSDFCGGRLRAPETDRAGRHCLVEGSTLPGSSAAPLLSSSQPIGCLTSARQCSLFVLSFFRTGQEHPRGG